MCAKMDVHYSIIERAENGDYDRDRSDGVLLRYGKQLAKLDCKNERSEEEMQNYALDNVHVYKKWVVLYKIMPTIYPIFVVLPLLLFVNIGFMWVVSPYAGIIATHWQFGKNSEIIFVIFMCSLMLAFVAFALFWVYLACKDNFFGHILFFREAILFDRLKAYNKKNILQRPPNILNGGKRPKRLFNMKDNKTETEEYCTINAPPYIAISHAWPKGNNYKKTITVDGCGWPVPVLKTDKYLSNLVSTVQEKIKHNGINHLWLDVLCVPQGNDKEEERDEEIPFLGEYYRNADFCFAFVGGIMQTRLGWREFLNDRWYKRVWTLQEACLNENTYILANIRMHSSLVGDITNSILSKFNDCEPSDTNKSTLLHIDDFICAIMTDDYFPCGRAAVQQAYAFHHLRETIRVQNYARNLIALSMLANRKCTQEKDKIFGIAGIASIPLEKDCTNNKMSLAGATKVLLTSLNGTSVAGTLGLCNMTIAQWIYTTIMGKQARCNSWIRGIGNGNMGFSGCSGECQIIDGALHGNFFVCPVCPLYWFKIKDMKCDKSIPQLSGDKLYALLMEVFTFGIIVALSMLVFKINYKVVLSIFFAKYVLSATLTVIVFLLFFFSTSNGAMLDTAGKVVGIFHCQNKILNLSRQLVLVINCENVNHHGLVAGNICCVVGDKKFSALYGVNIIMLQRSNIKRYPVIKGIIQ